MTVTAGQVTTGRAVPAPLPTGASGPPEPASAGRRGRAARRVPGLRLQPAAVAGAAARRPGHPDVGAAVPGHLPDRRLSRLRRHRRTGQRRPRPVTDRRPGPLPHHHQAAAAGHRRRPGTPAAPPRASPLLALRARGTLLPERAANAVAVLLRPLFRWPVVIAVIASVVGMDTGCSPRTGWVPGCSRSCATRSACWPCSACPWSLPRSTSAVTQPAAVTAARGPA